MLEVEIQDLCELMTEQDTGGWSFWDNIVFPDLNLLVSCWLHRLCLFAQFLKKTFKAYIKLSVSILYFN